MKISTVAVVGAGNMGSGIAQKLATEGLPVVLVDATEEQAAAGKQRIEKLLIEGLEKQIFTGEQVDAILERIHPTGDLDDVRQADLIIEAIFEDLSAKKDLFERLGHAARDEAILATNTSSFLVGDVAAVTPRPERVIGLHYFYHPAKNHLVEVIGHEGSDPNVLRTAWRFQEQIGKTSIASADAPGYVVNRFFIPWLNEAVRLHEEGIPISTVEAVAKGSFGIGMGPFQLMNVTGVPITMHAARSLADRLGSFYAPAPAIGLQVTNGTPWEVGGDVDNSHADTVADRLWGVVFHVALTLVSEGVSSIDDVDIGARVGLRWPTGPFEMMNSFGVEKTRQLCAAIEERYELQTPTLLKDQVASGSPFPLERVRLTVHEGVARILINRPDQLNALNPETIDQLEARFQEAAGRDDVQAIVIAGAGKAFVAGADVKFFVDKIHADEVDDIVAFAAHGQEVFRRIEKCTKRVVCQLDGLALGGGAELALACHVIVATPKASLGFPECGIGIYPGLGGTQRLTRRLGRGLARYFLYTGNVMNAEQLEASKLAWKVVPAQRLDATLAEAIASAPVQQAAVSEDLPGDLRDVAKFVSAVSVQGLIDGSLTLPGGGAVTDLARKIRRKAPNALTKVSELTDIAEQGDLDAGLEAETGGLHAVFSHPNALEGMSALLERRRPKFR